MPPANPYGSPTVSTSGTAYSGGQRHSKKLKRIEPLSLGVMQGALFAAIGLIPAAFFLVVGVISLATGGFDGTGSQLAVGLVGTTFMMVLAPVAYGVVGFIGGLIMALAYNLCASFFGGIELEFEE